MNDVNKYQIGGLHYKTTIEHWDYVIANDLNYFEGQITKYVTRCRKKNGLEDLQKAKHFLEKYMDAFKDIANPQGSLKRYEDTQPQYISDNVFLCEGGYGNGNMLYTHRATKMKLKASGLEDAHAKWAVLEKDMNDIAGEAWTDEPTKEYVKQD